jgi:hypothetical protein
VQQLQNRRRLNGGTQRVCGAGPARHDSLKPVAAAATAPARGARGLRTRKNYVETTARWCLGSGTTPPHRCRDSHVCQVLGRLQRTHASRV